MSKAQVCKPTGDCLSVDAMTATMMFYQEIAAGKNKQISSSAPDKEHAKTVACGTTTIEIQGQDVCIIIDFLMDKPLDVATFGILPGIRDAIIPSDNQGEIAKFVRDPVKRPIEIIQNWRNSILPKNENGEGAKIIRDPIKCTVGRLWGGC